MNVDGVRLYLIFAVPPWWIGARSRRRPRTQQWTPTRGWRAAPSRTRSTDDASARCAPRPEPSCAGASTVWAPGCARSRRRNERGKKKQRKRRNHPCRHHEQRQKDRVSKSHHGLRIQWLPKRGLRAKAVNWLSMFNNKRNIPIPRKSLAYNPSDAPDVLDR